MSCHSDRHLKILRLLENALVYLFTDFVRSFYFVIQSLTVTVTDWDSAEVLAHHPELVSCPSFTPPYRLVDYNPSGLRLSRMLTIPSPRPGAVGLIHKRLFHQSGITYTSCRLDYGAPDRGTWCLRGEGKGEGR